MYATVTKTSKFDLDDREDMEIYESILNDPLCIIQQDRLEKTRTEEFNEETGRIARTYENFWRIVVWTEKQIIT